MDEAFELGTLRFGEEVEDTPADDLAKAKELLVPVEETYRKCRDRYKPSVQAGMTPRP